MHLTDGTMRWNMKNKERGSGVDLIVDSEAL
jgi:hypothetical protein